jgi:hypothetical protein
LDSLLFFLLSSKGDFKGSSTGLGCTAINISGRNKNNIFDKKEYYL